MLISMVGILTQARMGVGRVTFLSIGPMRGQYVFLMAKYVLFMDVFYFSYYFHRLSLFITLKWVAYYFGRYPDSNQNGWLSIVRDLWVTDMSCLWQRYKIQGFCHKTDIMMELSSGQTKIRYRCSGPYVCVAVTEQRCSNDLRVLACFNLIWLSLQKCYLLPYCICLILLLRLYQFLCTGHIFPTPSEGIMITSLSTIFVYE